MTLSVRPSVCWLVSRSVELSVIISQKGGSFTSILLPEHLFFPSVPSFLSLFYSLFPSYSPPPSVHPSLSCLPIPLYILSILQTTLSPLLFPPPLFPPPSHLYLLFSLSSSPEASEETTLFSVQIRPDKPFPSSSIPFSPVSLSLSLFLSLILSLPLSLSFSFSLSTLPLPPGMFITVGNRGESPAN